MLPIATVLRRISLLVLALTLLTAPARSEPSNHPRNIILMIADGCGYAHVEAASHHATGQPRGQVYWQFPVALAMSTHPAGGEYDPQRAWQDVAWLRDRPTDSAAAITAMTTGVKTHNGRLNVTVDDQLLVTLVEVLAASGRATGMVTTVQFAHATPAGFAISHPRRGDYPEIARKILLESPLRVVAGAGHPEHGDDGAPCLAADYRYVGGPDLWHALRDGRAGVDRDGLPDPWRLIESRGEVLAAAASAVPPGRLLIVPRVHTTLQSKRPGDPEAVPYATLLTPDLPNLVDLTLAALNVLGQAPGGFGLMIEGGAVDWAAHDRQPGRLIEEQQEFDHAVAAVVRWLDRRHAWDRTLLVVTSDHECGHLCGPADGTALPPVAGRGIGRLPAITIDSANHTNALVPFFARGAGAAAFVALATGRDPVRGAYLDNTDLGRYLQGVASR